MVQAAHVLVGGGTGFVGRHLVQCLKSNGAKVQVITRKPGSNPDTISWSNIRDKGLPKETTAVVNLAGRNILEPNFWSESFKKEVYDNTLVIGTLVANHLPSIQVAGRIETNRLLVDAIHTAAVKPKAFVTVSGVGYYEPSEKVIYDENWTQPESNGRDYLMNLARDWEKSGELDDQHAPTTRRVIIRAGVVIGKDGGIIGNSKLPFLLGLGGPIGSGKQWFPWIHVDDLANMFKFAITNDHVTGIINGVAPEQNRNEDFAIAFGKALNRPAFIRMPEFMVKLMFGVERGDILLKGPRVKSRSGHLGFRYLYPTLQEACNQSVS